MSAFMCNRLLAAVACVQEDVVSEADTAGPEMFEHIDAVNFLDADVSDFAERDEAEPEQILRELPQVEQSAKQVWGIMRV